MKRTLVPTTLAFCASSAVALASPLAASAGSTSAELNWSGGIAPGATLTIVNPHGDIFVQRSDDNGASIRAIVKSGDAGRISITPTSSGRNLSVCTALPDVPSSCDASDDRAKARAVVAASAYRVDELVLVPAGVRVVVRGTVGKIIVEDPASTVDATTVDGDVQRPS